MYKLKYEYSISVRALYQRLGRYGGRMSVLNVHQVNWILEVRSNPPLSLRIPVAVWRYIVVYGFAKLPSGSLFGISSRWG